MSRKRPNVRELWRSLQSDGCTHAPDGPFHTCCAVHDAHYATHHTAGTHPLTRAEADWRLLVCMLRVQACPTTTRLILATTYWLAVRLFGRKYWNAKTAGTD